MDKQHQSHRQLHTVKADLSSANNKIQELREEIQKKQNQIMRQEADKVGSSVSSFSKVRHKNQFKSHSNTYSCDQVLATIFIGNFVKTVLLTSFGMHL